MHQATGRTFKELLLEKRLTKAAELLRETRRTTQDIIFAVGYENTSYFYRAFRARFGHHPPGTTAANTASATLPRAGGKDKSKDAFL